MDSEGNLVSVVLEYVLTKSKGHTPAHYEHVTSLTPPSYVEGLEVFRILGVEDSGLVRELQQSEVSVLYEPEGSVFEVNICDEGNTRFYFVATPKNLRLIAQDGDTPQTYCEFLRLHEGARGGTTETPRFETLPLEEGSEDDGGDVALAFWAAVAHLTIIPGVERSLAKALAVAGFDTVEKIAHADKKELADAVPDLGVADAENIINQAVFVLEKLKSGELSMKGWSESGTLEKPVRVVKLAPPVPEPEEKKRPTRMELPRVGQCPYCNGTLVRDGGSIVCRECGKRESTDRSAGDRWEDKARKLRQELRGVRS